jgi:hypothetical protein
MLKRRRKWRADPGARAIKRLANIEASIAALANEDLLDLVDIFLDRRSIGRNGVSGDGEAPHRAIGRCREEDRPDQPLAAT